MGTCHENNWASPWNVIRSSRSNFTKEEIRNNSPELEHCVVDDRIRRHRGVGSTGGESKAWLLRLIAAIQRKIWWIASFNVQKKESHHSSSFRYWT